MDEVARSGDAGAPSADRSTDRSAVDPRTRVVAGRVLTPAGVVDDGVVVVRDARIEYAGPRRPGDSAAPAGLVLPGLVDVHNHGGGGFSACAPGGAAAAGRHHLGHGTTATMASTLTDRPDAMLAAVTAAADAADDGEVLGIHVEGPFLAPDRRGAHDPRHLRQPDLAFTAELVAAGRGHVRVMTLAPELPGAGPVTDLLLERGVLPAVGHTEADPGAVARTVAACRAAGRVGLATHLFNAMPPLHHRAPGPAGALLAAAADGDACVELVADGVHLAEETVRMVFALLGADRVALVTDASPAAGMPDGDYPLGPQRVRVAEGVARLGAEGPIAGGTAHLLDVVRRCVRAGLDLGAVVTAASRTPASVLGLAGELGSLQAGCRADLVLTDDDLTLRGVMRAGEWAHGPARTPPDPAQSVI